MAYGDLIVYLADGTVQSYEIVKPTTAIGRSPGNDVVLPTSSASRYHAHISVEGGRVSFVDLGTVNGTFINDELLQPNASLELSGDEEIRIGDARLVFHPAADSPAATSATDVAETQANPVGSSDLVVTLEEPAQTVAPGARMQLRMTIENPSDDIRLCDVSTEGMDSAWIRTNRREVRLEGHETTEVIILVNPPRSYDVRPGSYQLVVNVVPHDDPAQQIQQTRSVEVVDYHGLGMVVRSGGAADTFKVYVQNQGNVPASIQLGGWHAQRALKYRFDKSRLKLAPGETQQVVVQIRSQVGRAPADKTTFAVVARSLEASGYQAAVPVEYPGPGGDAGRSLLLGGMLPMVLVAVLGAAMVGVAARMLFFRGEGGVSAAPGLKPTAMGTAPLASETPVTPPAATQFPSPSNVVASFDPSEVVRYQEIPIVLRYAVDPPPGVAAEELAFDLYDIDNQTSLNQFTVIDFEGTIGLNNLLGSNWLSSVYQQDGPVNYVLRVSVRDSLQTSSPPFELVVHSLACSVSGAGQARAGPGADYPLSESPLQAGNTYWPVTQANANAILWYQLEPGDAPQWVQADLLDCTLSSQDWQAPSGFRFFELSESSPTSAS